MLLGKYTDMFAARSFQPCMTLRVVNVLAQSVAATKDLALSIVFIEDRFADELTGFDYDHHSIKDMLDHLADVESSQQAARHRRSPPDCLWSVEDRVQYCRSLLLTSSSLQPHHSLNLPYSLDVRSAVLSLLYKWTGFGYMCIKQTSSTDPYTVCRMDY